MHCTIRRARACCIACVRSLVRGKGSRASDVASESPLKRLVREASAFGEAAPAEHELRWATQPYAAGPARAPSQADAPTPRPEESSVLLFPGHGSHFVGMGRRLQDVPAARDLYELASTIVGWDVWRVCSEGPAAELERRAAAALLVTSLAALERAREARPAALARARAAAGFALGELAALVFAAALPFERALRLIELISTAIQAASSERAGGLVRVQLAADARLAALLAAARDRAAEGALPDPVCAVAAYLHPNCKLIAGDLQALRFVETEGRSFGVRSCERVRGAPALHSALLARARVADVVRAALRECDVRAPRLRVVSCLDARPYRDARDVSARVARLATAPVRWEQTLHALFARPRAAAQPLTLALGPADALRSTLKMVNARAWDASVQIDV